MKTEHVILGVTGIALIGITYMYIKSRQAGPNAQAGSIVDNVIKSATASASQGTMPIMATTPLVSTGTTYTKPAVIDPAPILVAKPAVQQPVTQPVLTVQPVVKQPVVSTQIIEPVYTVQAMPIVDKAYWSTKNALLGFQPFTGLAGRIARA